VHLRVQGACPAKGFRNGAGAIPVREGCTGRRTQRQPARLPGRRRGARPDNPRPARTAPPGRRGPFTIWPVVCKDGAGGSTQAGNWWWDHGQIGATRTFTNTRGLTHQGSNVGRSVVAVVPAHTVQAGGLPVPQKWVGGFGVCLCWCLLTAGGLPARSGAPPATGDVAGKLGRRALVMRGPGKSYLPGGVVAVDDLSFQVAKGQVHFGSGSWARTGWAKDADATLRMRWAWCTVHRNRFPAVRPTWCGTGCARCCTGSGRSWEGGPASAAPVRPRQKNRGSTGPHGRPHRKTRPVRTRHWRIPPGLGKRRFRRKRSARNRPRAGGSACHSPSPFAGPGRNC